MNGAIARTDIKFRFACQIDNTLVGFYGFAAGSVTENDEVLKYMYKTLGIVEKITSSLRPGSSCSGELLFVCSKMY